MRATSLLSAISLFHIAVAHGDHEGIVVNPNDPWEVKHMKLEHGIEEFDPYSFFTLHDNDGSKTWTKTDILNLYGLLKAKQLGDGSGIGENTEDSEIDQATKDKVYNDVLALLDTDGDGIITLDEWRRFTDQGKNLPDFGLGPGHHGDYEYEYEVHHWQKYHKGVDPDVKVIHPEDVEHERLYHQFEHGDHSEDSHEGSAARLQRVPKKYLKH